jgi:hypothetical protein
MNGGRKLKGPQAGQKIVSILRAKRLPYAERPLTEPPCEVPAMTAQISEDDRLVISEADIRADIRIGDLSQTALRKCRFIIEHASNGFSEPALRELAIARTIRIIMDYGEPEGIPLISLALSLHGASRLVREAASEALSRMGDCESAGLLLKNLEADIGAPEAHLCAILELAVRFPQLAEKFAEELRRLRGGGTAFSDALSQLEAIRGTNG